MGPRAASVALLLIARAASVHGAVSRPSTRTHTITFEAGEVLGVPTLPLCDFDIGFLLTDQYRPTHRVRFAGPGFGAFNGGVIMDRCALSTGMYPPLDNSSVGGAGFLGFSTLHLLLGTNGKVVAPVTEPVVPLTA